MASYPLLVHRLVLLLYASSGPASRLQPLRFATLHLHLVGRGLSPPSCRTCSAHLLPPFGRETAPRGRRLTKTEEEETIIIKRPNRSTHPEEKSVLRSGATPVSLVRK